MVVYMLYKFLHNVILRLSLDNDYDFFFPILGFPCYIFVLILFLYVDRIILRIISFIDDVFFLTHLSKILVKNLDSICV